jgi:hypothetical protein
MKSFCTLLAFLCTFSTPVLALSNSCGPGYEKRLAQVTEWSRTICPKGMNTSKSDESRSCDIMKYPDFMIKAGIRMRCK